MTQVLFENAPRVGRVARRPIHHFNLKHRPMCLVPCCIAPVLPGDTMKNLLLQSRVVTLPVKNPLIGWWQEYYYFYVKLSQLPGGDDFKEMMLDIEKDMSAYAPTTNATRLYHYDDNGGIGWWWQIMQLITEEYFRDEGEAWNNVMHNNYYPAVAINHNTWLDSVVDATKLADGGDLGDIETAAEDVTMQQLGAAYRTWQHLVANQLTNASYEDYLASHGIRGALAADPRKPELIRYVRDWTYPSNTINAANGTPSSALSWSISERADKDRFFAEPGFIVGVTVTRPKLYLCKQKATLSQWLDNALMWLPAIMRDDPHTSLREFANNQGPLAGNVTNGYWVDMADLFRYGEQFVNYDPDADTTGVGVDLPNADLTHKYPTEAMCDTLFVGATATDAVKQDGITSLHILSAVQSDRKIGGF